MKLSLSILLAAQLATTSQAFVPFSVRSNDAVTTLTTARTRSSTTPPFLRTPSSSTTSTTTTSLFYELSNDANDGNGAARKLPNAWSVLADTEKWMSATLKDASESGNPLSRKEVSYVCETSNDSAMILANVFRKLKEFRLLGETHGSTQEELVDAAKGDDDTFKRTTLRQTQVLVIPANGDLNQSFQVFDELVLAINQARRSARDYVTDHSLEKLDDHMYGDGDRDWSVSVNFAHLHPKFGEQTPEEKLKELQEQEKDGEIDLNLEEYKARKMHARRSPYPSVVVEVRATPPPDFSTTAGPPPPSGPRTPDPVVVEDDEDLGYDTEEVTSDFVSSLEALFAKSAHIKDEDDDSTKKDFYDSIGSHIVEISAVTPMSLAQTWIDDNDPLFEAQSSSFTTSDTQHVDEAYEFVFTNLAMQTSKFLDTSTTVDVPAVEKRQYMVMSRFLTSSATSFEKFSREVMNIVQALPVLKDKIELSCLHPEHIDPTKRSPVPVFVMQWKD